MNKLILSIFFALNLTVIGNLYSFALEENQKKSFNPKPASASVYNLGLKSYEQGDLDSATTFFKKAVELDPEFIDAYFNLGAIYKKQKNYPMAINSLQKAVEINPLDSEAVFELASCYLENKDYREAKKHFSNILQDFPKYSEAQQNIEKADKYLAIENSNTSTQEHAKVIQSPDIQAQLLADTLAKGLQESIPQDVTAQLQLTKPTSLKESLRIVTKSFNGPTGIAKDSKNNVYVANFTKDSVERITPDGSREVYIEKKGIEGPVGLAIDENDNLYIANYNGASIIKVNPNKEVSVVVNNIERPYYLFYDNKTSKLFSTVQGNDSLVEIDTHNLSKLPITFK